MDVGIDLGTATVDVYKRQEEELLLLVELFREEELLLLVELFISDLLPLLTASFRQEPALALTDALTVSIAATARESTFLFIIFSLLF